MGADADRPTGPDEATPRVGVVMITHNRRDEALLAAERILALPERPPAVLVDNGSTDGTADAIRFRFPQLDVVGLADNLGAVGRNIGSAGSPPPTSPSATTTPGGSPAR